MNSVERRLVDFDFVVGVVDVIDDVLPAAPYTCERCDTVAVEWFQGEKSPILLCVLFEISGEISFFTF